MPWTTCYLTRVLLSTLARCQFKRLNLSCRPMWFYLWAIAFISYFHNLLTSDLQRALTVLLNCHFSAFYWPLCLSDVRGTVLRSVVYDLSAGPPLTPLRLLFFRQKFWYHDNLAVVVSIMSTQSSAIARQRRAVKPARSESEKPPVLKEKSKLPIVSFTTKLQSIRSTEQLKLIVRSDRIVSTDVTVRQGFNRLSSAPFHVIDSLWKKLATCWCFYYPLYKLGNNCRHTMVGLRKPSRPGYHQGERVNGYFTDWEGTADQTCRNDGLVANCVKGTD